jgi:serine phosphatase RsbU (regulator of sigma subunit)/catechol 2,3-dioxygenase-like lactoylglutathione lyase family enzyme
MGGLSGAGNFGAAKRAVAAQQPYLRLHCVNVFVRDQDRSLQFYVEQLGFHVAFDAKLQSGERWVAVAPPDGTAILSLVVPKANTAEAKMIGRSTHVVFFTEDVVGKFQEWSRRGVRFLTTPRLRRIKYDGAAQGLHGAEGARAETMLLGERSAIWGGVFARFRDIDGNSFSLVSFDEVTEAVETQRRAQAEKLEAERRAARELEIAKEVQARLFPQKLPALASLDYGGLCIQARQVGGDYYDFLDLGPARLGLVIGDISGKGIAAALLMANLQANLRSQCATALDQPLRLLGAVNRLFCENTPDGAFATLFFAEYDERAGRIRYANCGHLHGLILRSDGVERLEATATVLGVFKDWECEIEERPFGCGDMLALYTDGITESFDDDGEEFGQERLIEVLAKNRERRSAELMNAIVGEVRKFSPHEQHDDITLIVGKCRGN